MKKCFTFTGFAFLAALAGASILALASLTLTGCREKTGQARFPSEFSQSENSTNVAASPQTGQPAAPVASEAASAVEGKTTDSTDGTPETPAQTGPAWKPGDTGPNGGIVYFAQDGEFYEVFPPQAAVGVNDGLPAGWATPDMEDMTLIYDALQKSGAADYGAYWYVSVSKAGGKNQYFRFSDGQNTTAPTGSMRKIGVRVFDPAQVPAQALLAASGLKEEKTTDRTDNTDGKASSATVWKVGDKGPGGGTVFSASGGVYKEASPLITTLEGWGPFESLLVDAVREYRGGGFADWKIPTIEELRLLYAAQKAGLVNYSGYVPSGTGKTPRTDKTFILQVSYSRAEGADFPGFPGYRVILAAGGGFNMYQCINFSTGEETTWYDEAVTDVANAGNHVSVLNVVAVRTFK